MSVELTVSVSFNPSKRIDGGVLHEILIFVLGFLGEAAGALVSTDIAAIVNLPSG